MNRIWLPMLVLIAGIILLVLNIYVEDEPGGVPLLIIVLSGGWLIFRHVKFKSQRR